MPNDTIILLDSKSGNQRKIYKYTLEINNKENNNLIWGIRRNRAFIL